MSITNLSGQTLRINKIDATGTAAGVPAIQFTGLASGPATNPSFVQQTPYYYYIASYSNGSLVYFGTLRFAVNSGAAAAPTVDIENAGVFDVILAGVIDDPLGTVVVNDTGGNVVSTGAGQMIVARDVTLTTTAGNVGDGTNRLNATLVQSDDAGTTPTHHEPTLLAAAQSPGATGGAVDLDITGLDSNGLPLVLHLNGLSGNAVDAKIEGGTDGTNAVPVRADLNGGTTTAATTVAGAADLLVTNTVASKGTVTLDSTTGFVEEQGSLANGAVAAPTAVLQALTGISGLSKADNAFDLFVQVLEATAAAGSIAIHNTGGLQVGVAGGTGLTASGTIRLADAGSVKLAQASSTPGELDIAATGNLFQSGPAPA